jgi:hypothetical protein
MAGLLACWQSINSAIIQVLGCGIFKRPANRIDGNTACWKDGFMAIWQSMAKLTVRIAESLLRQLRIKCAEDGERLQDAVGSAIVAWLGCAPARPKDPVYYSDTKSDTVLDIDDSDVTIG